MSATVWIIGIKCKHNKTVAFYLIFGLSLYNYVYYILLLLPTYKKRRITVFVHHSL